MENSGMTQVDNIVERETIILSLYKKDQIMNTNQANQIINCIKKLNYYNVNVIDENKKYIINKVIQKISEELYVKLDGDITYYTISKVIEKIKENKEYADFIISLHHKINRAFVLSKFIDRNETTYNFYNALTLEELNKLNN